MQVGLHQTSKLLYNKENNQHSENATYKIFENHKYGKGSFSKA